MGKHHLGWIAALLLLLPLAIATGDVEEYRSQETIPLGIHLFNSSGDVSGANCKVQIRNLSFAVIQEGSMNQVTNGWYNYTYNTSKFGYHYCSQNCTLGTTYGAEECDFIVGGDESLSLAVMLATIFIIGVYLYLFKNLAFELFSGLLTNHGALKFLFMMGAMWLMLIPMGIAMQYNLLNYGQGNIQLLLETMNTTMLYIDSFVLIYFSIWFFIQTILLVRKAKVKGIKNLWQEMR